MTGYQMVSCSGCDSLDVVAVSECDVCDQPFCAECMDGDMCEACAERELMAAVDAAGAEA